MNKKLLVVGGVGIAALLLLAGTSHASDAKPDPNPNPPKPNKGPHPPPWPGLKTATVRVEGTNPATGKPYRGMLVRTGPSTASPVLAADPEVYNGQKVAALGEQKDATGRVWLHIYTPNGFEGWSSSVDPAGVRNIWHDDVPDDKQRPDLPIGADPNRRPQIADAIDTPMLGVPSLAAAAYVAGRRTGGVPFR